MPADHSSTLNHFALYSFRDAYWQLPLEQRRAFHQNWLAALRAATEQVYIYQVYPAESQADILVWSAAIAEQNCDTASFFERYARATNPHRALIAPCTVLWGYTRPSEYAKRRSPQEIDPFAGARKQYLVVYPFVKTTDWYQLGRETRQGMMNEHIKVGKEYAAITQLLLYSVGLQDQEFVVVYETDELRLFSDLVHQLRSTEGRRYTERDTPLHTAFYHPAEETLALWE